jgi:hypothetical protein
MLFVILPKIREVDTYTKVVSVLLRISSLKLHATLHVELGGLMIIVIATGPKVRCFKPGQGRWIFKGDNIRLTSSFGGEVTLWVPCRKI